MTTLTPKEFEVVELTAFGLSQDEIANHLQKSRHTVDELIRRAKRKLQLQKATELTAWYFTRRYNISLNLSQSLRKLVSAALLSLAVFSMTIENHNMLRVLRTPSRTCSGRTSGRSGRSRNEYDFNDYETDKLKIA
ncbi:sigma factor-like helix-turn-helix DNA-binding protein [Sunxiuqinia indica]|uniref:sigma factor-like helix-turn-helix DNA-binding protein n=1 Tax=Sunxiuqinia indica TaxID=2692584 RepID=UPI001359DB47|nr:helix-turn-helix transcriptional regulator [Sunxiuqinia indica]